MVMKILVKKYDGSIEQFDPQKLKKSLKSSKVGEETIQELFQFFEKEGINEISSNKIYSLVRNILLKKKKTTEFLRYNLPNAISKLGPEGFAFEAFIAQVFRAYGYKEVYVGKHIPGKCLSYEMDIVAKKDGTLMTAELKFHNARNKKSDLKVVLYMDARFRDIRDSGYYEKNKPRQVIITNTKFTTNAKKYSKCAKLEVLSWNHPIKNNLHDFILNSKIHPLTAIPSIPQKAMKDFIRRKIVSCCDLIKNNYAELKENSLIPKSKVNMIIKDINLICPDSVKKLTK